ncbi:death regulator Nedd2-like caspase [Cotesia typhae]|uniref:death regulator Nedd2-like caspase n=1 Tax=Cotesia typhae TaxID=2053667 RepID=UPI003D693A45
MEQEDRAKIDRCIDKLVPLINMVSIWPRLFFHQIFLRDDVSVPKWKDRLETLETKREILLKIKTRGPNAFKSLIQCLRETHQENLIILLENPQSDLSMTLATMKISNNSNSASDTCAQPSTNNNLTYNPGDEELIYNPLLTGEPLKITVTKSTRFIEIANEPSYVMKSNPRGMVLLITIIEYVSSDRKRESAKLDHKNLIELFKQMGLEVIDRINLTADEIRKEIRDFSKLQKLRHVDCCFVIVSAHGNSTGTEKNKNEDSAIHGVDHTGVKSTPNKEITCEEIIQYFSAAKCPNMMGKPKVFVFQACRGINEQKALTSKGSQCKNSIKPLNLEIDENEENPTNSRVNRSFRNFEDIAVFQSTLPGYVSFRDSMYGSWFIQIFCEVFMKQAYRLDLVGLYHNIDHRLKQLKGTNYRCQTATLKLIGFSKRLFINPGYFE